MPAGQVTTAARVPTTGNGRATRRRSSAASSEGSHAPWNQAIPRYRQLAAELIAAIESGQLRIGDELPSEYELCERYGVSRTTVREAFRLVELEGLISRQQGAVRKVLAKQLRGYTMSLGSEEETRQYATQVLVGIRISEHESRGFAIGDLHAGPLVPFEQNPEVPGQMLDCRRTQGRRA